MNINMYKWLVFRRTDGSGHISDLSEESIRQRCLFYNCEEDEIQEIIKFAETATLDDVYHMKQDKGTTVFRFNLNDRRD